MDEIAAYNIRRWKALAEASAYFTRPWLDLDVERARARIDRHGWLGDLTGKRVLLLATGGGQQSAAFALLGAHVTVADLSEAQLAGDRAAAAHYGVSIETIQADMRDLSMLPAAAFEVIWHAYSINFVPDVAPVFAQVARLIRPGGIYRVQCANPFLIGLTEHDWDGNGYVLRHPYADGATPLYEDAEWMYDRNDAGAVPPAREYRHTLATFVNGLIQHGFVIEHLSDQTREPRPDPTAEPGTVSHFIAVCPPWLTFRTRYRPDILGPDHSESE